MAIVASHRLLPYLHRTFFGTRMVGAITNVSFEAVKDLLHKKEAVIVDVREPNELKETGTIPGSINVPLAEVDNVLKLQSEAFKSRFGINKPNKDDLLVFSCKTGKRSTAASEAASKLGYTKIWNYTGGWSEWEQKYKP